jgi:phosphate-selective porin OprO/OprP
MSFYWDKGLHMRGKYENLQFLVGGNIYYDAGRIKSDRELDRAFPDIDGSHHDMRQLRLHTSAILMKALEIRFDLDFTNNKQLMDNWIRISNVPVLNRFRFGHIKEPFSLEYTTSSRYITFMERSLPVSAFSPGRNFGVRYDRGVSDKRFTWSAGAFVITGAAEDLSNLKEQIDEHVGYSLAFRMSGLPYSSEAEKKLLHLGLSFTHHFVDDVSKHRKWGISTYPESRIQEDVKLVDTGLFEADNADILNLELAYVDGPFSFQSEYIVSFIDADKSLRFWGIYASGSYFFTGEQRQYNTASGAFTGIKVKSPFHPAKGQWGALELAVRLSYIDLNDEPISGGKEKNITLGLNWYLYQKIRIMCNYVHAKVYDRAKPTVDVGDADFYMLRFQFSI